MKAVMRVCVAQQSRGGLLQFSGISLLNAARLRHYPAPEPIGPLHLRIGPVAENPPRQSFEVLRGANEFEGAVGPLHQKGPLGPKGLPVPTRVRLPALKPTPL